MEHCWYLSIGGCGRWLYEYVVIHLVPRIGSDLIGSASSEPHTMVVARRAASLIRHWDATHRSSPLLHPYPPHPSSALCSSSSTALLSAPLFGPCCASSVLRTVSCSMPRQGSALMLRAAPLRSSPYAITILRRCRARARALRSSCFAGLSLLRFVRASHRVMFHAPTRLGFDASLLLFVPVVTLAVCYAPMLSASRSCSPSSLATGLVGPYQARMSCFGFVRFAPLASRVVVLASLRTVGLFRSFVPRL